MSNFPLSFNDICKLVLEKKRGLEGTPEEREENFIQSLPPKFLTAYERAVEILKGSSEGLSLGDLYKDSVSEDEETGKRPLQIKQFKTLIDMAKKKVGNIEYNVYTGTYSLAGEQEIEDIRDGESPNIEDMDELDEPDDTADIQDTVGGAMDDYKRATGEWD